MTLLEVTKLIEYIAANQPNVNTIVESGDIFDLNKDNYEVKYSAFCATQRTHTFDEQFITFNFTLYYVDRLTADERNKIEVQSTAVEVLTNIYKTLRSINLEVIGSPIINDITAEDIVTFTEKFTAECAGAYMNISIITSYDNLCETLKINLGDFAPDPYSDDFYKWAIKEIKLSL